MDEDDFQALWLNASEKEGYASVSEGRMILISLGELRFIDQRCQLGLKSTLAGNVAQHYFINVCHVTLDTRLPLFSRVR